MLKNKRIRKGEIVIGNTIYLVTGAAGFLGGHVCRQLIARGDKVRAFALPGDKAIQYIPEGVEVCEASGCKPIKTFLPLGIAYKLAAIMEKAAVKSGKEPLMTTFSVYNLDKNNNFDYFG